MIAAATRKRLREAIAANKDPESSSRGILAARATPESTPFFWRQAASLAEVSGADAFLAHLGRSITAALQSVSESAEAARAQLRTTRAALHAAIDTRCDELEASLESAEIGKVVTLERELFAVDAALERWRADSSAVHEALASMCDADLETHYATLSSRLDDTEEQLRMLPTAVMEPPHVGLSAVPSEVLECIAGFGRVISPLAVAVADLSVKDAPAVVRPGAT